MKTLKKVIIILLLIVTSIFITGCDISKAFDSYLKKDSEQIKENENFNDPEKFYEMINEVSINGMKANLEIFNKSYKSSRDYYIVQGSGVIFLENSKNYYALTNAHVVNIKSGYFYQDYEIYDYLGNKYSGKVLYSDSKIDLAIIKFSKSETELNVLEIETKNPNVNDPVISIGQPNGQNNFISLGKVTDYTITSKTDFDVIKHSAPLAHGSSGGVLLNENLKIVGINFATKILENNEWEASYSIPCEIVLDYIHKCGFLL